MVTEDTVFQTIVVIIISLGLGVVFSWIAYLKKYYTLPYKNAFQIPIQGLDVFMPFLIYFIIYITLPVLIGFALLKSNISITSANIAIFIVNIITWILLYLCMITYIVKRNKNLFLSIWKNPDLPQKSSYLDDALTGIISWVLSYPWMIAISALESLLIWVLYKPSAEEQAAVQYLKGSLENPITTAVAIFIIVFAAPVVEEFLFRGVLLTWLRRFFGSYGAIFLSALCFSLLHYAYSQGINNLPIISALFVFGLYLGFVYEKTRSLFSSISLHVTLNCINVIKIIYM